MFLAARILLILIYLESMFSGILNNLFESEFVDIFKVIYRIILLLFMLVYLINEQGRRNGDLSLTMLLMFYIFIGIFSESRVGLALSIPYCLVVILFVYSVVKYNVNLFESSIVFIFNLNSIFMILQFLGISEIFYLHQTFSVDDTAAISFFQSDYFIPNQQHRPHGIFSNTIYLSLFELTFLYVLIFSKNMQSKLYYFSGIVFPLIGSKTIVAFMALFPVYLMFNKRFLIVAFSLCITYGVLFLFFHEFLQLNYGFSSIQKSFELRTDSNLENNMFQKLGIIEQLGFLPLILLPLIFFGVRTMTAVFIFGAFLLAPLFLHPIFLDIKYAAHIAVIFGYSALKPPFLIGSLSDLSQRS